MNFGKFGLTILVGLILAACGENNESPRGKVIGVPKVIASLRAADLDLAAAASGLLALTGNAKCDVTVVQINYQTPGTQSSEMSNASAAVLIPSGASCPGPFPLIAYAKSTDVEKPRTMANPTDSETLSLMAFYAAQGYAVVATDYLGYALSSYPYPPYLQADSEASSVIDSIRATRLAAASLGLTLNGKIMVTGYSEGGHASMATQRTIERENTGEFKLVAAAHLAGPYNLSGTLVDAVNSPLLGAQIFVPFAVTSMQKIYGTLYAKATDVFNSPYDSYIESLLPNPTLTSTTLLTQGKLPADAPLIAMGKIFKSSYLSSIVNDSNNATIVEAKKQDLLGWNPAAPTTLCAGLADPTVKFLLNAKTTYDDFRSRGGTNVTIVDVDPAIQSYYGSVLAASSATYYGLYHGTFEPPFCYQEAKKLFDLNK
jgi:pimeloyl-ACP methyl ester carboxylesterase